MDVSTPALQAEVDFFERNRMAIGYSELAAAQFCVGLNVISGKFLMAYFPIFLLLTIRCSIGLIAMLFVARCNKLRIPAIYHRFMKLSLKDKGLLVLQAMCGCFFFNVFILYGMQTTTATAAGIISSITPIMTFILAAIFLRERISFEKWVAIFIVVLGLMVLSLGEESVAVMENAWIGNLLVFCAVIPEALFTILSKSIGGKLTQTEAVILVNAFNLMAFIPLAIWDIDSFDIHLATWDAYGVLVLYGISGGILFFFLWYRGLEKVSANIAALFTGVMPISTTVLAFFLLNERIQWTDMVGMGLVILAIVVGCRSKDTLHV